MNGFFKLGSTIFSDIKFIDNSFLNILGLHVFRILIAHCFFSIRSFLFFSNLTEEQKILRKNGIIIIKNFFPDSKFESIKGGLNNVVIGKVITCEKHPNADRLKVTTVDVGENETF